MNYFNRTMLAAMAALAFAAPAMAQQVTLHLGHTGSTTNPGHIALEAFAAKVAANSNGEINIIVYPAEQLATLRGGVEGVQLGTIDIYAADSGTLGNWAPKYAFVSLPFMFPDFDAAIATMAKLGGQIDASLRTDLNVERLGWVPAGFRVILTKDHPINSAADMKGLKIRVPEIPLYVSTFAALHANATPLPWADVYGAMQTGVVEGVEGPPVAIVTSNFQDVGNNVARTNHILTDLNLLMNLDKFNSLTPAQQEILRAAAKETFTDQLAVAFRADDEGMYKTLAGLITANDNPDMASFQALMQPVYDDFVKSAGDEAAAWIAIARGE